MNAISAVLLLLAAISQTGNDPAASRKLVVFIDKNRESQILKSELTRDWAKSPSAELAIIEARRKRLMEHVEIVDLSRVPLHQRPPAALPAYAWGQYGRPESFDSRSFNGSGCALYCTECYLSLHVADIQAWEQACERAKEDAAQVYCGEVFTWIKLYKPSESNRLYQCEYGYWPHYDQAVTEEFDREFREIPGYPQRRRVVLPKCPLQRFPWEAK